MLEATEEAFAVGPRLHLCDPLVDAAVAIKRGLHDLLAAKARAAPNDFDLLTVGIFLNDDGFCARCLSRVDRRKGQSTGGKHQSCCATEAPLVDRAHDRLLLVEPAFGS